MAPRPKNPPPDRRKEILDAALHIFAQKGYNATTNADIARFAGVTPAALYYYFPSKEELFRAAVNDRRDQIEPALAAFSDTEILSVPPGELLPQILHHVIAFLTQERTQAVLKIIMAEGPRDLSVVKIWEELMISVVGPLTLYLIHHMEQGRIRQMDPRLFFLALQGPLMAGVITRDLLKIPMLQDLTDEMLVQTLVDTTLRSMLTEGN